VIDFTGSPLPNETEIGLLSQQMASNPSDDGRGGIATPVRPTGSLPERILIAAPRCIARWGLAKTTLDDLAREAGCSRASIYRHFPGGKDQVLVATLVREEGRLFADLAPEFEAAESLEDLLVTGLVGAARFIDGNDALQYLITHEPEVVLPHVAFDRVGPMLHRVSGFAGPYLERFLSPRAAVEGAQWAARPLLTYSLHRSESLDRRDRVEARRFVRAYLLPPYSSSEPKGEPHVIH
jgi:AcrR family transcriptional regulator